MSEASLRRADCNCNTIANDCLLLGGTCKYGVIPCERRGLGCGQTFLDSCNGICIR